MKRSTKTVEQFYDRDNELIPLTDVDSHHLEKFRVSNYDHLRPGYYVSIFDLVRRKVTILLRVVSNRGNLYFVVFDGSVMLKEGLDILRKHLIEDRELKTIRETTEAMLRVISAREKIFG